MQFRSWMLPELVDFFDCPPAFLLSAMFYARAIARASRFP